MVHVGGTMRPVMEELAKRHQQKTGRKIEINTADSGALLAQIETQREGDIYVCHDPFLDILMRRGLGRDGWTVAALTPVIVVSKVDPPKRKITDLSDFEDPGVSLALPDEKWSTLGKMLPTMFKKAGIDLDLITKRPNVSVFRQGTQAANVARTGNANAAVVWNAVAYLHRDALAVVPIPPGQLPTPGVDTVTSATNRTYGLVPVRVTIATLGCSKEPTGAADFAKFVASDEGRKVFQDFGYSTIAPRKEYEDGKKLPEDRQ
ncbi:MAG TPA: extracellular solute-binding protein [Phycisphaerae bacterium]|nr:extracellular solute-binding protein [Phycisphaerae bacterium]